MQDKPGVKGETEVNDNGVADFADISQTNTYISEQSKEQSVVSCAPNTNIPEHANEATDELQTQNGVMSGGLGKSQMGAGVGDL